MNNKKILIVSPFFPYPTNFGGVYDTWERLKGLSSLNCEIDLLYTNKVEPESKDIKYVKKFVRNLYGVKRKNRLSHLFHTKPLQVVSRNKLKNFYLDKKYDLVILETESVAAILQNKTLKANRLILRVQNNETIYFKNLKRSTGNLLKKIFYFSEEKKYAQFSKKIFSKMDRLWYISLEEEEKYRKNTQENNSIHVPSPINYEFKTRDLNSKNVLFIGSLFMDNNIEAVNWYLDNVHEKISVKYPNYNFIICGSTGDHSEEHFLTKFRNYKNIKVFLNVKDLEDVYSNASVFVNPMQHGAGVKLKSINAIVNGLPLVATVIGCEGIGMNVKEMFYLANNPKEFAAAISDLFDMNAIGKKKMIRKAQDFLKSNNYLEIIKSELSL